MSEVLLRGWNVAVPVVDVGDDVLIIDDNDKTTFRLQVKSTRTSYGEPATAKFTLSRQQLRTPQEIELLYYARPPGGVFSCCHVLAWLHSTATMCTHHVRGPAVDPRPTKLRRRTRWHSTFA
jgi:hypothetical protein